MPEFPNFGDPYIGVNEFAADHGLMWDGQYGSPYDIEGLIRPELRDTAVMESYERLFDHTKRFKPRGSGAKKPVLAVTSPYLHDTESLREFVEKFAARFGLNARVNDPRDRIYAAAGTIPILFWRADLHTLKP